MITRFRIYELIDQGKPEIGDYVICKDSGSLYVNDFLKSQIGKVVRTDTENRVFKQLYPYVVQYSDIPKSLIGSFMMDEDYPNSRGFYLYEILYWSKDVKDLDFYPDANKYNL
jgi:hypothetical protein